MNAVIQDKTMGTEKELIDVNERTERNRKAIPQTVLRALEKRNVTLDDVLRMTRDQFERLDDALALKDELAREERRPFINFKHQSMTHKESLVYFEPTEEEYQQAETDPDYQPLPPTFLRDAKPT